MKPRLHLRLALALIGIAGGVPGQAAAAADGGAGLGAVFRPQAGAESTPGGTGAYAPGGAAAPAAADDDTDTRGVRVVLVGAGRRVASVDGRVVHVGDRVNGLRVVRITLQEVVLAADDGSTQRLFVNPAVAQSKRAPAGVREPKEPRP